MKARRHAAIVLEANLHAFAGARRKHARRTGFADGQKLGHGRSGAARQWQRGRKCDATTAAPPTSLPCHYCGQRAENAVDRLDDQQGRRNVRFPEVRILDDQHRLAALENATRRDQCELQTGRGSRSSP